MRSKITAFVIGILLAFSLPAVAQFGGTPSYVRIAKALGLNVAPTDTVVTAEVGSPPPNGIVVLRNDTDGTGGFLGFLNRETGIDATTDFFSVGPGTNGGIGELSVNAPWGQPLNFGAVAGGASGVVSIADSASTLELRGTRHFINSNAPIFDFVELDAVANEKVTRFRNTAGLFEIASLTDALGAGTTVLQWDRNGASINGVTINAGLGHLTMGGSTTIRGIDGGSAAAPAFAFVTDTNTGMYEIGDGRLGFSINGVEALDMQTLIFEVAQPIHLSSNGTTTLPAITFVSDNNMGLYRVGADQLGITLNAANAYTFAAGQLTGPAGSAAAPAYSFSGDPNTGVYNVGADNLGVSLNGALEYDFNATVLDLNDNSIDDSVDDNVNVSANMSVVGNLAVTGTISGTLSGQGAVYGCYVDSAATAERCPTGWSASVAASEFTVTHNLGLANANDLAISCTVHDAANDDRFCQIDNTGVNSFGVSIIDVGAGLVADDFSFTAYRIN